MKNKLKVMCILVCTLTLLISSTMVVSAEESYTHYFYAYTADKQEIHYYQFTCPYQYVYYDLSDGLTIYYPDTGAFRVMTSADLTDSSYTRSEYVNEFTGYNDEYFYNGYFKGTFDNIVGVLDESDTYIFADSLAFLEYYNSLNEEPETEESTEEPTTEEPTTPEEPTETETNNGIAGGLVYDLIGDTTEFTPQSVMAIFVVCLVLECLSHIASALLSVGGMK